jgi:hypothetical protein
MLSLPSDCYHAIAVQAFCTSSSSTSTAVLQKLLQLAAGNSSCSAAAAATDDSTTITAHITAGLQHVRSGQLQRAGGQAVAAAPLRQQQQVEEEGWRAAALEALQLFSFEELGEAADFGGIAWLLAFPLWTMNV